MSEAKHPNDMSSDELSAASDALSHDIEATLADCSQKIDRLQAERADLLAVLRAVAAYMPLWLEGIEEEENNPAVKTLHRVRAAIARAEGRP